MDPFKDKLDALKTKLVTETEFRKTFHFFFDHLGENLAFMRAGKDVQHPHLERCLKAMAERVFNEPGVVMHLMLFQAGAPDDAFFHGTCYLNGRITTLFFFEALDMGMAAIHTQPSTSLINFARFSTARIEPGKAMHFTGGPGTMQ